MIRIIYTHKIDHSLFFCNSHHLTTHSDNLLRHGEMLYLLVGKVIRKTIMFKIIFQLILIMLIEGNGLETWQSFLLYTFVCYFRS